MSPAVSVELGGRQVPLRDCDWVLWAPCGCPAGVTVASTPDEGLVQDTEMAAWMAFYDDADEIIRAQRRGEHLELMTHERWSAEVADRMTGRCGHAGADAGTTDRLAGGSRTTTQQPSAGGVRQAQDPAVAYPVRGGGHAPAGRATAAASALPAGQAEPRTWTVALPAGLQMLSLNDRLHWRERNLRAQVIKDAACVITRQARVPRLARASVAVEYQPPDRRRRDADNPVASAKAAVDGIVLAGVLEDDECPRYVTGIRCTIGETHPRGRLVLHITEVAP